MSLRTLTGVGLIVLLADTAYIWAFASPTIVYMTAVVAHLAIGVVVAICAAWLLVRDRLWRQPAVGLAALFLLASTACAGYLVVAGNVRDHRWALEAHIIAGCAAIVALMPFAVRIARRGLGERMFGLAFQAAAILLVVLPVGVWTYAAAHPNPADRIVNPRATPLSMQAEGGGPSTPFFPSSAQTTVGGTIPADFFTESETCGECHRDIYDQWQGSMHHFASFNNQFYRKSIEHMQSVVGTQPSKWCAGCHDHAVFFNGRFDRPISEQIDTVEARAGLGCTSCHSIVRVGSSMGNGDFTVEYPPLHRLASSRNRYIRAVDRFLTYLDPEPHRRTFMKPFVRQDSAEFCASCHKVHLDKPVNDYRWFRGFNDYDAWQASGVSGQGARSFYYPAQKQTCVDCHMPSARSADPGHHADGTIHSHRFAAANTAVPFVNHDRAQYAETERFLKSGFISVDIFAASPVDEQMSGTPMVRRPADAVRALSSFGVGEEAEVAQPATIRNVGRDRGPPGQSAAAGRARIHRPCRRRRSHEKNRSFFSRRHSRRLRRLAGARGARQDGPDDFLERSRRERRQGPRRDGRALLSVVSARRRRKPDQQAERVADAKRALRAAHSARSSRCGALPDPDSIRRAGPDYTERKVELSQVRTLLHAVRVCGTADSGPGVLACRAWLRQSGVVFRSVEHPGERIERNPGSDSGFADRHGGGGDDDAAARRTTRRPPQWTPIASQTDRERWNDWGIGLLLQGDLKGAEYAFTQVTKAEPGYADGWLNVARALIQEGETDAAKPFIAEALRLDRTLGRIHYFKALIEKADGDYAAALRSLETAAAAYPRDRVVLNQIARILFLGRRFDEALKALDHVQDVDPEDLQMHYTAMLCYRALGRNEPAAREEALFLRFKADEASQAITHSRRMISPEDNNERQLIHEHDTVPLGSRP